LPRLRTLQRFCIAFFAANAFFVLWPGIVPFRNARPFILGLPFPLVWVTLWVIAGFFVLLLVDSAYRARERDAARRED